MKNEKNPGQNPNVNTGKATGSEKSPDTKKSAETKTKGEEVWKNPDPTAPERKNDPDPTKPEKQEGPYSDKEKGSAKIGFKTPQAGTEKKKNPPRVEDKDDEIGSLEEQDIDNQGTTDEADDDTDFSEEDERKSA